MVGALTRRRYPIRRTAMAVAAACVVAPSALRAQATPADSARRELPAQVAQDVAELYNAPAVLRSTDATLIAAGQTLDGDVAVLRGPLTVSGHVSGRVVVVNGDVYLRRGARVDRDVVVVGGIVLGADSATVGGAVHAYTQSMRYHRDGDRIEADVEPLPLDEDSWFARWRRRRQAATAKLALMGGTYNRVEGLPVTGGFSLRQPQPWGAIHADLFGIYRSADHFAWKKENRGYNANVEVQVGRGRGVALGGRLFDDVASIEPWQMRDAEVSLASFFLHRDFRDWYNERGATGYLSLFRDQTLSLRVAFTREHWDSRPTRDPFTIFRNGAMWRPNPVVDEGLMHRVNATVTLDTRNEQTNPADGWLVHGDLEYGSSPGLRLAPTPLGVRPPSSGPVPLSYTALFVDARRYIRTSPVTQLDVRVVAGGWLGGDPLPLERRASLGGPGTLPGFDFRSPTAESIELTCNVQGGGPGVPALCDRMLLGQAELRRHFSLNLRGRGGVPHWWDIGIPRTVALVGFTDLGRGWLVGSNGGTQYGRWSIPPFSTFRSDVGAGIDFNLVGFFVAKALAPWSEPANFVVRLRHRF